VIGVDTNLLVYAHREDSPWHDSASQCIADLAEGSEPWAIPWPCIHEFLAIVTNPRIFAVPTPVGAAFEQVDAWVASPSLVLLSESEGYSSVLRELVVSGRATGAQIHDARVAALCAHQGVRELWTADRDFGRFPRIRVRNPLVAR